MITPILIDSDSGEINLIETHLDQDDSISGGYSYDDPLIKIDSELHDRAHIQETSKNKKLDNNNKFVCKEIGCNKSYPLKSSLCKHKYTHTREKYQCDEKNCGKVFGQLNLWAKHKWTAHTNKRSYKTKRSSLPSSSTNAQAFSSSSSLLSSDVCSTTTNFEPESNVYTSEQAYKSKRLSSPTTTQVFPSSAVCLTTSHDEVENLLNLRQKKNDCIDISIADSRIKTNALPIAVVTLGDVTEPKVNSIVKNQQKKQKQKQQQQHTTIDSTMESDISLIQQIPQLLTEINTLLMKFVISTAENTDIKCTNCKRDLNESSQIKPGAEMVLCLKRTICQLKNVQKKCCHNNLCYCCQQKNF